MAILNYTTTVDLEKSISEIQKMFNERTSIYARFLIKNYKI